VSLHVQWDSTDTNSDTYVGAHTDTETGTEAGADVETGADTTTIPLFQSEECPLPELQDPRAAQNQSPRSAPPVPNVTIPKGRIIVASAPVRVDLAGGWSDTPPICYETEGAVSPILLFTSLFSFLTFLICLNEFYRLHSKVITSTI
jgi:hypothetical protein